MKTHKIVKVDWVDPANYTGWKKGDEVKDYDPMHCITCGILTKVQKGNVGVTQSIDEVGKRAEIMVIPRKAIEKIEVISTFRV